MTRQAQKAAAFRALHEGEPFVIPNPWDAGSARVLEALGFRALATTSSGFAFTLGRRDGEATLDEVVQHTAALDRATMLPVSVDLENAYGAETRDVAQAVTRVAEAGAVGCSIEDYDSSEGIYDLDQATDRVIAAANAAHALPYPFLLTARAENHLRGNQDLEDTIARLQAYERAGADVLYAPGLETVEEIHAVCGAISRPVNVLARPDLSLRQLVDAGAQRISVGGARACLASRHSPVRGRKTMGNYDWRRDATTVLRGGFVTPLLVGGTTLATFFLPRWGSRVRIPSSARKDVA
jgi:2-methylisocitrate lyase-like PEP mutase family enzyme